ncbi:MAG: CoA transferase [Comamonadaceae bacterium]|nr:CoA transferase [Comamonadaceae bacterium]
MAVADLFTGHVCHERHPGRTLPPAAEPARGNSSTWRCSTRRSRCSPTWEPGYLRRGQVAPADGQRPPGTSCPTRCFAPADGFLIVAVGNDEPVRPLLRGGRSRCPGGRCRAIARSRARARTASPLVATIAERLATRPAAHWLAALEPAGCHAGRSTTSRRHSTILRSGIAA